MCHIKEKITNKREVRGKKERLGANKREARSK
jgi:hypothetical protein